MRNRKRGRPYKTGSLSDFSNPHLRMITKATSPSLWYANRIDEFVIVADCTRDEYLFDYIVLTKSKAGKFVSVGLFLQKEDSEFICNITE